LHMIFWQNVNVSLEHRDSCEAHNRVPSQGIEHFLNEALRAFCIEGRRLHDIAQQFGYRETSLRSIVCRFRAQVQAGEVPPFLCNCPWGDPSGSLTP